MSEPQLERALKVASNEGAELACVRMVRTRTRVTSLRSGNQQTTENRSAGIAVEVVSGRGCGFAAVSDTSYAAAEAAAREAVRASVAARIAARSAPRKLPLGDGFGEWEPPVLQDPFSVAATIRSKFLRLLDDAMRQTATVRETHAEMAFRQQEEFLVASSGAETRQRWTWAGLHLQATAARGDERRTRTSPGRYDLGGWERFDEDECAREASRMAREADLLLGADSIVEETGPVVLAPHPVAVLLHETLGHLLEDPGTTPDEGLRIAGGRVQLSADPEGARGAASCAFDSWGRPAVRVPLITDGKLVAGWGAHPFARLTSYRARPRQLMPNLRLEPTEETEQELMTRAEGGLYVDGARRWSLDAQRRRFVLEPEIAWRIEGGQLTAPVLVPRIEDETYAFWRRCHGLSSQVTSVPIACSRGDGDAHWTSQLVPTVLFSDVMACATPATG